MNFNFFRKRVTDTAALFTGHFVDVKAFYTIEFDRIPCITFIGDLDMNKAFDWVENNYAIQVQKTFQHNYFDHQTQQMHFNNTIFILHDNRMIELANNYCQVLHTEKQFGWANKLAKELAVFKQVTEIVKEHRVIGFARQNEMN